MKLNKFRTGACSLLIAVSTSLAQPVLAPFGQSSPSIGGNKISNVRIVSRSKDGTEIVLALQYQYDGLHGDSVRLLPVIQASDIPGAHRWFGVDPVDVPRGKGFVSMKIRYFNDEENVPMKVSTDRIRILFVHSNGHLVVSTIPLLKSIHWGSSGPVRIARASTVGDVVP